MSDKVRGTVKWFNESKGFGFIESKTDFLKGVTCAFVTIEIVQKNIAAKNTCTNLYLIIYTFLINRLPIKPFLDCCARLINSSILFI